MFSASAGFFRLYRNSLALLTILAFLTLTTLLLGCGQTSTVRSTEQMAGSNVGGTPSLSLASSTVLQNGEFSLSADGFSPGEPVVFRAGDGSGVAFREIGRAKADAGGVVRQLTIRLPSWVTSGSRSVEAQGQVSGQRIESVFYVRADKPWLNLGSYAAKQDSSLGLNAGGFEPGERISAFFEQQPQNVVASATADPAGNVEWIELALRGLQAGQYNLILLGDTSQIKLTAPIVVSARSPWVDLHAYTVGPGGNVGFDGHDFAPGERVRAFLDEPTGTPVVEAVADEAGNLTLSGVYTAKPGDVGRHRMILIGELTTGDLATAFDVIPFTPAFQMTTYSGPPGTEVSFNGSAFAPGETVRVFMQGREQPMATIDVANDGSFVDAGRFMVPRDVTGGNLGMTLVGEASGARLTQSFSVTRIQPFLGLDVYAGPPGTVVRFRGLGFAAGETVKIHLGNREGPTVSTVTTDLDGRFGSSPPAGVPSSEAQDVAFTAVGESSGAEAAVKFQVIQPARERQPQAP